MKKQGYSGQLIFLKIIRRQLAGQVLKKLMNLVILNVENLDLGVLENDHFFYYLNMQ